MVGRTISHYEIVEKVGEGGMGVVYKAHDSHLDRFVALKVLPPGKVADPQRKARFVQEAKAASALNHPNIITIHDVSSGGGRDFIVMEYIVGKTLDELIPRKGMRLSEGLKIAVQIADALARAHAAGIIHRDLKPSNVMVDEHGLVKVLDFGLAKLTEVVEIGGDAPTRTMKPTTEEGAIMGTAAFMSPEQAEGKKLDARSDIFSFGAVLYEMVAGQRAFRGDTKLATLSAVLRENPPALPPEVPHDLAKVVMRCMQKDPDRRFQHMADVRVALREMKEESESGKLAAPDTQVPARWRRFPRPAISALALVVLAAGGVFVWQHMHATPLTGKDMLVLGDFTNTTGDAVFDDTLKQGLSVQLEQSPFLSLVSGHRVNETLKLMGQPAGDRLTPEVAREICQRTSSKAMLTGSIDMLGSQYVLGLKAVDCTSGNVLAEAQEQAAAKEAVLKALDAAAVRLRGKLGESIRTVQKYATPLAEATTSSLDALKAFSLGMKAFSAEGDSAAQPFFQRAVDLDPGFAVGYISLGASYFNLNEGKRATGYVRKAYDLREKVSEFERLGIEGSYYQLATGELEKAAQRYALLQRIYPREYAPYAALGVVSTLLGDWQKALEQHQTALRLDPSNILNYDNLGQAYSVLNRLNDAEAVYKQAEERKLQGELSLQCRYLLAFLKSDETQMARIASAAMGKRGAEGPLLATQADTEGWYGKLKNAHELTRRAMASAQGDDAKEAAAAYQAAAALREVETGNREQALADAGAAVKLAPNRDVQAVAALAMARAGETAGAENLAAELDKTFPLDTLVRRYWLPTIRAAVSLDRKDPNRAIELLVAAGPIELSGPSRSTIFLCPAYVRGQAYLKLRDGNRAAAEFLKFNDHRGLVVNFPWGALARLGMARAYTLQGDKAKALAAYQDFLGIWKDADPDLAILLEARREYAKLRQTE